jgi:two-component system, OmpR family, sensor kinase
MMRSLERSLLAWILGALSLGALLLCGVIYVETLDEMNDIFDLDLRNVAQALSSLHQARDGTALAARTGAPRNADNPEDNEHEEPAIVTVLRSPDGRTLFSSDPQVALPFSTVEGHARVRIGNAQWNTYTSVAPAGIAQAAQLASGRREIASDSASTILALMVALVALSGGLLVFALRRGLRPLSGAARDVASRSAASLEPIEPAKVPKEVAPLVHAINELMQRLSIAFTAQRRFVADAAHELRTPVAALRLQLQLLQRAADEPARRAAMAELDAGITRSQHLIEQLLQLARAGPDAEKLQLGPVALGDLVRSVVVAFSAKAESLQVDLGADAATPARIQGDRHQLTVALNNLVENALRYSTAGGVVDVVASELDGLPALRVIDNGPGIPAAERARVFDRFYRGRDAQVTANDGTGSGLGLSIVQAIAQRHGARVSLHDAPAGRGLEVRIVFERAATAQ